MLNVFLFLCLFFYFLLKIKCRIAFTNSVDPDQTPRLHCLPMSLLWYTKHESVNTVMISKESLNCVLIRICFNI